MSARASLRAFRSNRLPLGASVCPSCQFASLIARSPRPAASSQRKHAYSTASRTAVNASKNIPPRLQELYGALEKLSKDATNHVNLSRLQLALKSLETDTPIVRIAVLGLNGLKGVRQLARLLTADALDDEGSWERQLAEASPDDSRSYILRYGHENSLPPSNAIVSTIHIPSPLLQRHNLELLISSINLTSTSTSPSPSELRANALVPLAETPTSASRPTIAFVRYPVHHAIILGDGVDGALALGKFPPQRPSEANDVQLALNLSLSQETVTDSKIPVLNIPLASEALDTFRQSTSNASIYQSKWHTSNLPQITTYLSSSLAKQPSGLPLAISNTLNSLLTSAASSIPAPAPPPSSLKSTTETTPIQRNLQSWSIRAHTELATSLDATRASKRWRQLAWWKLAWRADDVSLLLGEILDRYWLVDAEKGVLFLAGRAAELGLHPSEEELYPWLSHKAIDDLNTAGPNLNAVDAAANPVQRDVPVLHTSTSFLPSILSKKQLNKTLSSNTNAKPDTSTPWPLLLPAFRSNIANSTIPPLHAKAQRLLLTSSTLAASSLSLSALLYISFPVSLFEAGAFAALGGIYALRRLQKQWERAREDWIERLREQGRVGLGVVEGRVRGDVAGAGAGGAVGIRNGVTGAGAAGSVSIRDDVDGFEEKENRIARAAVMRAREALDRVESSGIDGLGSKD